ncbi:MAG TPA: 50S ribosomal protein L24 [Candidatus Limnocylindrales bacterium]|nr:50S ribosomal protein L24 [Candidatus Limnocylindrales bacterium]
MQQTRRVKNPRKQRKKLFNSPAHIRHKLMSAPLSKDLAASRGTRTLPVRKGDTVRILRGDNKGFEGKVQRVALNEFRIYIEGLTREKVDGTNIFLPVHPSKVQIRNLNLEDRWRKDILARKKEIERPEKEEKPKAAPAEVTEKPEAEAEEIKEEKPVEALPVEEKAVPETAKEEAPPEKVSEKVTKAAKKAPTAKKARAKKPAAVKKPAAEKEAVPEEKAPAKEEAAPVVEEKAPAKKAAKPKKPAAKKATPKKAPEKKATAKKTAAKPRVEHKGSKETKGGQ